MCNEDEKLHIHLDCNANKSEIPLSTDCTDAAPVTEQVSGQVSEHAVLHDDWYLFSGRPAASRPVSQPLYKNRFLCHRSAVSHGDNDADDALFETVMSNSAHTLQPYLPERANSQPQGTFTQTYNKDHGQNRSELF